MKFVFLLEAVTDEIVSHCFLFLSPVDFDHAQRAMS